MSGRQPIPGYEGRGLNEFRDREGWLNRTVRGHVVTVDPGRGRASVSFEGAGGERTATIPVGWMSIDTRSNRYAWSRYMPTVGDIVLLAFDTNGDVHVLGYDTLNYEQLQQLQEEGVVPHWRTLQPGEWDQAGAGGAYIHGGINGTLELSGRTVTWRLKGSQLRADLRAPLMAVAGDAGSMRVGDVKRQKLPTDPAESGIVGSDGSTLKEFRVQVSRNVGGLDDAPQAEIHAGDIIDSTLLEERSAVGRPKKLRFRVYNGLPSATGTEGTRSAWISEVDQGGNWTVEAGLAGAGATFTFRSTTGKLDLAFFDVVATATGSISARATSTASLEGVAKTVLGGSSGVHPAVFGDALQVALNTFCSTVVAVAPTLVGAIDPTSAGAIGTIATAAGVLQGALAGILSTNVFLDR
jgi:hypothetical protein